MKTFLLALAASTLAAFSAHAQTTLTDSTTDDTLKPQAKSIATELNVNPFNGTISLNNSINQLKFRYFTADNFAVRVGFNGTRDVVNFENSSPYGTNSYRAEDKRSSNTFGVNLGIEKHFAGTRRLSPYIGADLTFEKRTSEHEITQGQTITTITGAWRDATYYSNGYTYTYTQRGYSRYGLNVLTGFDFYMAKNLFFGYEMHFGFNQTNFQDLEVKQSGTNGTPSNNGDYKNSNFTFGPKLLNGVRIGYVF